MFYPIIDLMLTSKPIAEIIKPDGTVSEYPINTIAGRFFFVRFNKATAGIFEIDHRKAVLWREEIMGFAFSHMKYYYDAENMKPMPIHYMNEIEEFKKANNIKKLTRQHQRDSKYMRDKENKIESVANLIPKTSAEIVGEKILTLEKEGKITIIKPMSMNMSDAMDEFKSVEPEYIFNCISTLKNTDVEHKKLQSKSVKGVMQLGGIIMIAVVAMVVAMFLPQVIQNWGGLKIPDVSHILPNFPPIGGHFLLGLKSQMLNLATSAKALFLGSILNM